VRKIRFLSLFIGALSALVGLSGCAQESPEDEVARLRSRFDARVNSFYVEARPQVDEMVMEGAIEETGSESAGEAAPAAEGEEVAVELQESVLIQDAHLDLIVQHDNDDMLAGVTLEILMVDASQQEKGRWQVWVDTSKLLKANQLQLTHVLEDVAYVEGDGFAAEVRSPIPPTERGNYREFASLGE